MNKEEIAPGIVVYSNVIPNSENLHNDIEEGISSSGLNWIDAKVLDHSETNNVNTLIRNTLAFGVEYLGKVRHSEGLDVQSFFNENLNNLFFEHCDPIEKDYMQTYGIFSEWHDHYGVLKYGAGQFFSNHIDDHPSYHRRISTVYYLNDSYTGGEINFPRFNVTFKPKANQMIVFPSTYVYNHSVSPVIEGERYAVVSWLR